METWETGNKETNKLPENDSQSKHIFRDKEGHLNDTPSNRKLLENTANKQSNFLGTDKYGNEWYSRMQPNGTQVWVQTRNGTIIDGGLNTSPKTFDPQTGLKAVTPPTN